MSTLHDFDGATPLRHLRQGRRLPSRSTAISSPAATAITASRAPVGAGPCAIANLSSGVYPFGWLGVLAEVPPADHELIYANHERGFALCSMRSTHRSRYYVQCPHGRSRRGTGPTIVSGTSCAAACPNTTAARRHHRTVLREVDRAAAFLRRRADALRPVVPGRRCRPHSAADRRQGPQPRRQRCALSLCRFSRLLPRQVAWAASTPIPATALARVWKAVRFSWWMTTMLHRFPDATAFDQRIQEADLAYLVSSRAAMTTSTPTMSVCPTESRSAGRKREH